MPRAGGATGARGATGAGGTTGAGALGTVTEVLSARSEIVGPEAEGAAVELAMLRAGVKAFMMAGNTEGGWETVAGLMRCSTTPMLGSAFPGVWKKSRRVFLEGLASEVLSGESRDRFFPPGKN